MNYKVIIIGGGLAGLVNAILLARAGMSVALIERKVYPFHRVCGEYISNETLPFLNSLGIQPVQWGAATLDTLQVTSPRGTRLEMPLDLGGFGISRYVLDEKLFQMATQAGVTGLTGKSVEDVAFENEQFTVTLSDHTHLQATYVIGAYGKRSKLDKHLQRQFIHSRSPYIGVKYHIRTDFPSNQISLHNFTDGYCGINAIEESKYNLCYLTTRENLRRSGSLEALETEVLQKNPFLKSLFQNADFLFEKPEVINEISFAPKTAVENHILMSGDSAGMITPLCGNGMAIAIHSAKLLSDYLIQAQQQNWSRQQLEQTYAAHWNETFARRLWVGRHLQRLFGDATLTDLSVRTLRAFRPLAKLVVTQTHGVPF